MLSIGTTGIALYSLYGHGGGWAGVATGADGGKSWPKLIHTTLLMRNLLLLKVICNYTYYTHRQFKFF